VAAEFAVALVLLAGSGLLMRSFLHIRAVKLGFDPTHVATMDLHLPSPAYDGEEAARSFVGQAIQRIASLPGVTGAAAGGLFSEHQPNTAIVPEGQRGVAVAPETHGRQYVSANYFRVLGIPLYRGRGFTAADNLHARPVAVINRAMARRFWPNQDPLGRRFKQVLPGLDGDWLTVVGVVGDVLLNGRESRVVPMFYRPRSQIGFAEVSLVARTAADPLSLAAAIRREVRALDPSVPHFEIFTVDERLETMESARRFETKLLSIFAGLALLLATIGIYGLLHYAVTERTREMGIRIALGAQRIHVVRLILGHGLGWAVLGIGAGVAIALLVTRLLQSLLFGVAATDPWTFTGVALLLLLAGAIASSLPARRAAEIDPLIALREE
jgi:putative ABC transport system permease protein